MIGKQDFTIKDGVLFKYDGPGGDVAVPDGVRKIGDYAFQGRGDLASVAIPEGVEEVGDHAFDGCTGLKAMHLPDGVRKVGLAAFANCTGLERASLPEGVTELPWAAFYGCTSLESVYLPDGLNRIGWSTFSKCSNLEKITIPDGIKRIGGRAFYDCGKLADASIPASVEEIGNDAFGGCPCSAVRVPGPDNSINPRKLDLDGTRRPVLQQALTEAMEAQPEDMRGIYRDTLAGVSRPVDRVYLTSAQVSVTKSALELYGKAHATEGVADILAASEEMLRQLAATRKEYHAGGARLAVRAVPVRPEGRTPGRIYGDPKLMANPRERMRVAALGESGADSGKDDTGFEGPSR